MKTFPILTLIGLSLILAGCQTTKQLADSPVLEQIGGKDRYTDRRAPIGFTEFSNRTSSGKFDSQIDGDRFNLLRDGALAYSAQAGYRRRVYEISRQWTCFIKVESAWLLFKSSFQILLGLYSRMLNAS